MADHLPNLAQLPSGFSLRDRLDSWKEIAAYLNCSERTVRRWEQEGLPVHRHPHKKKAGIYAYKAEIDAWWQNRREGVKPGEKTASPAGGAAPMELLPARALLVLLVTLGLGLGTWLWLGWQAPPLEIGQFVRLTDDGHDKHGNLSDGIPSPIVTDGTRLYFVESRAVSRIWFKCSLLEARSSLFPA